jgi:hypothetical protein
VAWDFAIQPHGLGGVKLLDPITQASSLLAKLLIRGLRPGFEPWKIFLLHRLNNIRLVRYGTWPPSTAWLSTATKIRRQGSHMFMGLWAAWCTVRSGLTHALPTSWAETLRQPLFGNTHLRDPTGNILGIHSATNLGFGRPKASTQSPTFGIRNPNPGSPLW